MKKFFAIAIALVMTLTLAIGASAAKAADDAKAIFDEIVEAVGIDKATEAVQEALGNLGDIDLLNVDAIPDGTADKFAASLKDGLGLDSDVLDGIMSNEFVSFLAGIYMDTPKPPVVETTIAKPKTTEGNVVTGSNPTIAIAAFATITAAAAVAFVCLKKKED